MATPKTREQLVEELSRLYRLRDEGKHVDSLIAKYEALLCEKPECDDNDEEED